MKAMVKTVGVLSAAITITFLIMSGAQAQKIAFFRHNPTEKLDNFKAGRGSGVLTAAKLTAMTVSDLLDYDILYIEGAGPGFAAAMANKDKIARAVELGLGLYVVGSDPVVFSVAPVPLQFSPALGTGETRIPVSAAWHPASSSRLYDAISSATDGPVTRAFTGYPARFEILQEVHVGKDRYLPTILTGKIGYGNVILRTTSWRYESKSDAGNTLAMAMTRFLSDGYRLDSTIDDSTEQLASTEEF